MNQRSRLLVFVFLALLAFPSHAFANAGTPLMWAAMLHLAIGNGLIGAFEGLLLAWLFKAPKGRAMTFMVVANYFSAWVGGLLLRGVMVQALPLDLNNAWKWFWVMVGVTYILTLVLELPFIIPLLRGSGQTLRRSVRASFVVQTASYVIIFGWYWGASRTSLFTRTQVVTSAEMSLPKDVTVYFISRDDGDVYKARLGSGEPQKVFELNSTERNDRLLVNWHKLVARFDEQGNQDGKLVPVITNLAGWAVPELDDEKSSSRINGTWFNFGSVPSLGSARTSDWSFFTGFWAAGGMSGHNDKTKQEARFAYETPFGSWMVRNAVLLPTDKVLFQLGHDQICAFDPETRRVVLLWRGRGPVPFIE